MLKNALKGLLQLLYPRNCEGCNDWLSDGEKILCLHCAVSLPRTGFHHIPDNQAAQKFIGRVPVCYATSFAYFSQGGIIQHLMHRFKYGARPEIGRYLGRLLAEELLAAGRLQDIEIIVPVPLHKSRERGRGFNQSAVIAEGMSEICGLPVITDCLVRKVNNESQTSQTRARRIENARGIFAVGNSAAIEGRHILLIDDVLTTGATLESAASELLRCRNVRISLATVALTID